MRDDRSQRVVYKLSFNLTQIFQHLLGWFLIPPSNNKGRRVNNRRNNNQEYLERHVQLIKQNRGGEGCRFNRPSSDVGRSKQCPHPWPDFLDARKVSKISFSDNSSRYSPGFEGGKGMWKVEIRGKGRKEEGGKKKDPLLSCRPRWYPVVTLCESGESLFLVVATELGRGTHKREIWNINKTYS